MKYNSKIDMVRYFKFNNKWVMVKRSVGRHARYYIDGLFMWTRATNECGGRLFQNDLELEPNKEYDDWAPYTDAPSHIPNGQLWRYYFMKWRKEESGEE
jgi:hypothetical protein